jgi:hypothetical protein
MLKLRPAGNAPSSEYDAIAAPVEEIVYPTNDVVATRVSDVLDRVKDGVALITLNVNVALADPPGLVPVIV